MLKIKELIEYLKQFPEDMELVETRYSDLTPMHLNDWGIVQGIYRVKEYKTPERERSEWIELIQRPEQLSEENKAKLKSFVHFAGN